MRLNKWPQSQQVLKQNNQQQQKPPSFCSSITCSTLMCHDFCLVAPFSFFLKGQNLPCKQSSCCDLLGLISSFSALSSLKTISWTQKRMNLWCTLLALRWPSALDRTLKVQSLYMHSCLNCRHAGFIALQTNLEAYPEDIVTGHQFLQTLNISRSYCRKHLSALDGHWDERTAIPETQNKCTRF